MYICESILSKITKNAAASLKQPIKTTCTIIASLLISLCIQLPVTADRVDDLLSGFEPMKTLITRNVFDNPLLHLAKYAHWPLEETIARHHYSGNVKPERSTLLQALKKTLKPNYLPSELDIANAIPCVGLWEDGSDYLILRYKTKSGTVIDIQDGRNVSIMFRCELSTTLDNIKEFTLDMTSGILDLTSVDAQIMVNPGIPIFKADIGESRIGEMRFGNSPVTKKSDWYTSIGWWSDGKNFLLSIPKTDFEKQRREPKETMRSDPRIFESRSTGTPTKRMSLTAPTATRSSNRKK